MFHRLVRKACGRVSRSTARSPRARLFLKPLEERTVPALFTVTNNNNDLAGSLRQAIIDANGLAGADTINFAGPVTGSILLTSGEMTISDDLTITGPGASVLKLDGNAASRIFNINKAGVQLTVNISGLTMTNCVAVARGGAVTITDENVTFAKCEFSNNKGTEGGAINVDGIDSAQSNVYLTLDGCMVNNNSTTAPAPNSDGGGINLEACVNLTVRNTTISGNTCLRRGGGIYFLSRGSMVMENSTVSGNVSGGDGGGVYFYDRLTDTGFTVRNSTFSGNQAGGSGGGLALIRPNGVFTFENSTIANNTAVLSGGGIFTRPVSTNTFTRIIVESTVISGNNAITGVDVLTDGTANPVPLVARHSAIGDTSTVSTYIDQGGNIAPGTPLDLGPLQNNGGQVQTHLPLNTSPLINAGRNPSGLANDSRGTGFPRVSGARADIGAAEVQNDGTPTAAASENNVSVAGAAVATITVVYADNGLINFSTLGTGDITVSGPGGFSATPTLKSTTPSVNAASITATYEFTPPGGTWTNDDNGDYVISIAASQVADTLGNFVAAGPNALFQVGIARSFVVNTNADSGLGSLRDAIVAANTGFSFGDVITFDSVTFATPMTISMGLGEMLITKPIDIQGPGASLLTIDANLASRHFNVDGLLPYAVKFSGMTLTKGTVAGNGGSINSLFQDITISKSVVTGNAAASGGAVNINGMRTLNSNVFLTIENSTISNNKTTGAGGAIRFSQSANLIVRNSTISGNQATGRGGVIYFNRCGSALIENSTVSGNTSGNIGGVFYFYESVNSLGFNIRNSTLSGNKSTGGGVLVMETDLLAAGKIMIQNSTLTLNESTVAAGGAIRSNNPTNSKIPILVESSIISGNINATAPDISTTGVVTVSASAIGSATGFTLTAGAFPNLGFGATLKLGPLQNNGGPTQTHFPGPGSPLRNSGANTLGLANDQRGVGFNRVLDGQADIGSVESTDPTPTAKLTANDVVSVGATEYSFTVTYSDSNTVIDVSTIGTGDVTVAGPNGFMATPTFVSVDNPANGTPRTATYKFTPPGGSWDVIGDLGAYTISVNGSQVFDTDVPTKNSVLPGPLGSFAVRFPTTFVVTTNADSGIGSLRQAILNTNANLAPTPDTITFNFGSATTVTLNTAELLITDSVVITGTGVNNLTVARDSVAPQFRIFNVNGPGVITVAISGMTITGGDTAGNAAGKNGSGVTGDGAALLMFNDNVTLDNVAIVNNKSGSEGGGIGVASVNNENGGAGTLTIRNSTISSNSATGVPTTYGGAGGGIYFANGGTLNLENSTVSGNSSANWMGGGLYLYGNAGLANYTIRNSTISGNTSTGTGGGLVFYTLGSNPAHSLVVQNSTIASNTSAGLGGGIGRVGTNGTATLFSSIVADNAAGFGADITGDFLADFSLVEDASGGTLTGVSNLPGIDPQLLPLANNGGPTQTHKLQATSPALDAGSNSKTLSSDQRGGAFLRTFNDPGFPNVADGTDIGAFELQPIPAPPQVKALQVNDGSAQRSLVTSIKVTFSEAVTFPSGISAAFKLERTANGSLGTVNLNAIQAGSIVTITFASGGTVGIDPGASLEDGSYKLTIFADKVSGTGGTLDGDGDGISEGSPIDNKSLALHRLFGDADGNASVTASDFNAFRLAYGTTGPSIFDFNGDNTVSASDFNSFRTRYGVTLMP